MSSAPTFDPPLPNSPPPPPPPPPTLQQSLVANKTVQPGINQSAAGGVDASNYYTYFQQYQYSQYYPYMYSTMYAAAAAAAAASATNTTPLPLMGAYYGSPPNIASNQALAQARMANQIQIAPPPKNQPGF